MISVDKYSGHIIHKSYISHKNQNDTYRRKILAPASYLYIFYRNQPTYHRGCIYNGVKIPTNWVPTFSKLSTDYYLPGNRPVYSVHYGGEYGKICDSRTNIRSYHKDNETKKMKILPQINLHQEKLFVVRVPSLKQQMNHLNEKM